MTTPLSVTSSDISPISQRSNSKVQGGTWQEHFEVLLSFKNKNGHCLVPHTYPENPCLARWVKRQRYQYKQMTLGKPSSMSISRIKTLEEIGFVWDSHKATWEKMFQELLQYKEEHGNCDIPSKYSANPGLATWVTRQRGQHKQYLAGKQSHMTTERFIALDEIGFKWSARQTKPSKPNCGKRKAPKRDPEPMKKLPLSAKDYDLFMDVLCDLSDDEPDQVCSSSNVAAYPKTLEIPMESSTLSTTPANIFLGALNDLSDDEVDNSAEFSMDALFPEDEKNIFATEGVPISKNAADFLNNVIADMSDDEDSVQLDDLSL